MQSLIDDVFGLSSAKLSGGQDENHAGLQVLCRIAGRVLHRHVVGFRCRLRVRVASRATLRLLCWHRFFFYYDRLLVDLNLLLPCSAKHSGACWLPIWRYLLRVIADRLLCCLVLRQRRCNGRRLRHRQFGGCNACLGPLLEDANLCVVKSYDEVALRIEEALRVEQGLLFHRQPAAAFPLAKATFALAVALGVAPAITLAVVPRVRPMAISMAIPVRRSAS
mmetsp:Transcript_103580/g.333985  ORF Transcript_103580/g.333985 Transcript_103580/m.333985 type:complete len:222 (+) Transcript_103580:588-1253(+)